MVGVLHAAHLAAARRSGQAAIAAAREHTRFSPASRTPSSPRDCGCKPLRALAGATHLTAGKN
ncbi:hypothetical protein RHECIAT_CH0000985 [Rhizobium etli CIAT 652]|uniref:Uncharacterized protein n=1 Tax=Rhizobium etli (strain CIAT 652) TaxID=491916 RepID=B3PRI7_RHIE6|nr:hypothetical protein RHECIAT_CH0000985 [Rhizobium etli CIAT 652]